MDRASKLSLSDLWDETIAFLRAEIGLVAPVAFLCFGLPTVILLLVMPMPADGTLVPGAWLWALVPAGVLSMTGSIALSALALHPGVSVKESLGLAIRALPAGLGLELLNIALQVLLAIPIVLATMAEGGTAGPVSMVVNLADLAFLIWLYVRVLPIWALLAERRVAPLAALRESFALTRGHYRKLLVLRVVAMIAGVVALLVVVVPIDALFGALAQIGSLAAVANTLGFVATAAAAAIILSIWTVYVARLYVRLTTISGR